MYFCSVQQQQTLLSPAYLHFCRVVSLTCRVHSISFSRALSFKLTLAESFSGLSVRNFKGFPSLQEIECQIGSYNAEVNVFSLKLFRLPSNIVLAHANPVKNECQTFGEYSSCRIDIRDTRKSTLNILVSDLKEGESRRYGCTASSFGPLGATNTSTWSITVKRNRKSRAQPHVQCCSSHQLSGRGPPISTRNISVLFGFCYYFHYLHAKSSLV